MVFKKLLRLLNSVSAFRICTVTDLFFGIITYTDTVSRIGIGVLSVWALYLIIRYYIIAKEYKQVEYHSYLLLFLGISVVTAVLKITGGLFNFAVTLGQTFVNSVYFFLFFGMQTQEVISIKKEFRKVCRLLFILITVFNAAGFILLVLFHQPIELYGRRLIILENRFIGVFTNPNPLGYACVFSILCGVVLLNRRLAKNVGVKVAKKGIVIPCMVLNFTALMLSASIGATLLLVAFAVILCCCYCFQIKNASQFKKIVIRCFSFSVLSVVILSTVLFTRNICSTVASNILKGPAIIESEMLKADENALEQKMLEEGQAVTFEHLNEEIDDGRFKLYSQAAEWIIKNPLTGIGSGNIFFCGKKNLGVGGYDLHNAYLSILASNGIFAFLIFAVFGSLLAKRMFILALRRPQRATINLMPLLFSFIGAYCAYAMLEPTMLYNATFVIVTFWYVLSVAFCITKYTDADRYRFTQLHKATSFK